MVKKLTLLLCMVFLLALVACKQDTQTHQNDSSTVTSSEHTISGIELEEDVFDDSATQGNQSSNNNSTGATQSSTTSSDTNVSKDESADNSPSDTASTGDPDTEDSNSSKDGVTVEDGVIKLPIDKFD
ncbi:MAG: hypothetical protein E7521_00690 [Ruminococcaceae bacterium]|nr:hypothetical protein [Oscillospiraceae bacterium]